MSTRKEKSVSDFLERDKSIVQWIKRKAQKLRAKETLKKMHTKKPNPIFSVSTLKKIRFGKQAALTSARPTHCNMSTETVPVSNIVIGEDTFGCVKVGDLNSLDLQCAVKEEK